MGKSPRRSPRLNSDTMDVNNPASTPATSNTAVKKSTSQNDTATIAAGTASAPSIAPSSTGTVSRNSSTTSRPRASTPISRQEAIMQAVQKRIAMLENSLKAAEVKLKEHESHIETVNAPGSAYIAGMSAPQLPQIQQVVPLPDLQLPPNTATNSQPLASLTDSRQLPISFATTTQNMYTNSDIHQSNNLSVNSNTPINANMGSVAKHSSYLPRQMQVLPDFCGKAEDWPMFYTAFTESTAVYVYSNFESNQRLHKYLKVS
ncbi:serine/threonine-protein kinase pakG-like isoform X2 [Ceratitis capitata]|uniref:serine/threonine-protein kinase pakG-like isoform X2 n=1 Tax=Ceratitis capitata TaxID=7213 RepID=UPI000C6C4A29|nr:serine/threonine-protein kinase pakG-like isoform X2 [Ceratitis capitata]